MKNIKRSAEIIILVLIIMNNIGCTYSFYMSTYPYLETIYINDFDNKSEQYDIDIEVNESLIYYFNKDKRLRIVSKEPDCTIEGSIESYRKNIKTINAEDGIECYEVKIVFSIDFYDNINNEIIWSNSDILMKEEYYPGTDDPVKKSNEEEARKEIYKNLFDKIIENTLEKW